MGMNGITAQAELARALEEIANRKDGKIPSISSSLEQPAQDETTALISQPTNEDVTEITACISTSPKVSENSEPGIDVAKLRRTTLQKVNLNDLFKGYVDTHDGRRSSERYNIRLAVVVYSAKRSFRTATSNISYGGVRLKEKMPEQFTKGEIEILVIVENKHSRHKEYFLMTGKAVTGDRVQFTSASVKAKTALRQLMQNLAARDAA